MDNFLKSCYKNFLISSGLLILLALFVSSFVSIYYLKALTLLLAAVQSPLSPTTLDMREAMINQKLQNLSLAMAEFEGWAPDKSAAAKSGGPSVSYRNHNPLNMRKSIFALGVRDGFAFFFNDATGFFAAQYDIMQKAQGNTSTGLTGESTLRNLIRVWSAGDPDSVENYTAFVCRRTGLTPGNKN